MKNPRTGYLLAFFLGITGAHLFYYKKYFRGSLYLLFSWTYVPIILGWFDMIFIKKWTAEINNQKSTALEESLTYYGDDNITQDTLTTNYDHNKNNLKLNITKKTNSFFSALEFYNEKNIILSEYSHLETPKEILESLKSINQANFDTYTNNGANIHFSINTSHTNFVKLSIKYSNKRGKQTKEIPFNSYWPTFDSLNDRQLKWYFYWREQVLKSNYIDVDLSYIFIFVYELLNYSFNTKASFNISMLIRLKNNYEDRYPELKKYLSEWIADMLYELGETELALKWDSKESKIVPLYIQLENNMESLDSISITYWKPYLKNHRKTEFFKQNRNKIYSKFKKGIVKVQNETEEKGRDILTEWFELRDRRVVRDLYHSAVMGRSFDPVHVYVKEFTATSELSDLVTNLFRLSENVVRKESGVKREIKVDDSLLPDEIKDNLLKKKDRFKIVQSKDHNAQGSSIPQKSIVQERKDNVIEFNWQEITRKEKELNKLQTTISEIENFENTASISSESTYKDIRATQNSDNDFTFNFQNEFNNEDEDYDDFHASLTEEEKNFILMFDNGNISIEKAKAYAKNQGMMLGFFLTQINEKANEFLEDILFEEHNEKITIIEDFQSIVDFVRGDLVEN